MKTKHFVTALIATTVLTSPPVTGRSEATPADMSQSASPSEKIPLRPDWENYKFDGKLGETKTLPEMQVCSLHVGQDDSVTDSFNYEPPPGWIILSYSLHKIRQGGDTHYAVNLTAPKANFSATNKVDEILNETEDYAAKVRNYDAKAKLDESRHAMQEFLRTINSTNNHLEIKYSAHSHRVRDPITHSPLDTKTAALELGVVITIARTASPDEVEIIKYKLKRLIDDGKDVTAIVTPPELSGQKPKK